MIAAALVLLVLLAAPQSADVRVVDDVTVSIERSTLVGEGTRATAWFSTGAIEQGPISLPPTRQLIELDCQARTMRILRMTMDGRDLDLPAGLPPVEVAEGRPSQAAYDLACPAAR